jgi:hypothetical protein
MAAAASDLRIGGEVSDLVEFLLARIAEDERDARNASDRAVGGPYSADWDTVFSACVDTGGDHDFLTNDRDIAMHIVRWDPARVLAECEARRRIVEFADEATSLDMQVDGEFRIGSRDESDEPYIGDSIMRALALPYADSEGYREEWRP